MNLLEIRPLQQAGMLRSPLFCVLFFPKRRMSALLGVERSSFAACDIEVLCSVVSRPVQRFSALLCLLLPALNTSSCFCTICILICVPPRGQALWGPLKTLKNKRDSRFLASRMWHVTHYWSIRLGERSSTYLEEENSS